MSKLQTLVDLGKQEHAARQNRIHMRQLTIVLLSHLQALVELGKQGQVALYWSTAALLQKAGLEGPSDGADAGADAVLWRCDLCGVPATSARNLEVMHISVASQVAWD